MYERFETNCECAMLSLSARRPNSVRSRTIAAWGYGLIEAPCDEPGHVGKAGNVSFAIVSHVLHDAAPRAGSAVRRRFAPQLDDEQLSGPGGRRHAPECTPPGVRSASDCRAASQMFRLNESSAYVRSHGPSGIFARRSSYNAAARRSARRYASGRPAAS
jgi:hypothetical protein